MTPISLHKQGNPTRCHMEPSQRRAGKACQSCRARKIKCEVMRHGVPCKNCRDINVLCLVPRCRRGRKLGVRYTKRPGSDQILPPPRRALVIESSDLGHNATSSDINRTYTDHHQENAPIMLTPSSDTVTLLTSMVSLGDIPPDLGNFQHHTTSSIPRPQGAYAEDLPSYIQPLPLDRTSADVEFVRSRGALSVPDALFRNELIRCYVEYMHPYMPLLDIDELLQIVDPNTIDVAKTPKYSLLLFQSIMFAAVAYVDEDRVREAGFEDLKAARKAFYQKTKILYDMEFESDSLTLIQSLVLMSLWSAKPEAHQQSWHWMGIAISVAQELGLTRNPDALQVSPRQKSLYKRVWWCCFMRDRLLSLAISRTMRIREEDFDVPFLTIQDFEIDTLSPSYDTSVYTSLCDKSTRTQLAQIFIAHVELCRIVGLIISTQYSTLTKAPELTAWDRASCRLVMLFPISDQSPDRALDHHRDIYLSLLDTKLGEWYSGLPDATKFSQLAPQSQAQRAASRKTTETVKHGEIMDFPTSASLAVQCALLHTTYNAAISALHRPQKRSPASGAKVFNAATNIAHICAILNERQLVRYLSVNVIPMLVPGITSNALFIKSMTLMAGRRQCSITEEDMIAKARDNFSNLMVSLSTLRAAYVGADSVFMFVDAFLRRARLKVVKPEENNSQRINNAQDQRSFDLELEMAVPGLKEFCSPLQKHGADEACIVPAAGIGDADHSVATVRSDQQLDLNTHDMPNAGVGNFGEHPDLNFRSSLNHIELEDSVWFDMLNFSPFDNSGMEKNIDRGDFAAGIREGNEAGVVWDGLDLDLRSYN